MSDHTEWWKGAVIYQIYPRSYHDSNGDGIGDLAGITEKMDYIASLGVDAIWISPFFKSPMADFGYDVSDYRDIDPMFGTMADFDEMMKEAHKRGVRIVVDLVLSHTSNQHQWFQESRQDRTNPKADWYVWADPRPDGGPPSNWLAYFGGPSWSFDNMRGQYYQHNFLPEQPDLNLRNPEVQQKLLDTMDFWMAKGVDGVRLDAIRCYFCDPSFPDNPVNEDPVPSRFNIDFPTPHSMQHHVYDEVVEPGLEFCKKLRAVMDKYPERMAVAEVGGPNGPLDAILYSDTPEKLHTAYHFGMLSHDPLNPDMVKANITEFEDNTDTAWPSWAFSNHDVSRVVSRWFARHETDPNAAKLLNALLISMRGCAFLYQGEELGLPEATIPREQIQDPWGVYLYPKWQGRDGCRTPMPWSAAEKNAGFSTSDKIWLPIDYKHLALCVVSQDPKEDSTLNFTRKAIAFRKSHKAMQYGDIEFVDSGHENILAFKRLHEDETIMCIFNLSPDTAQTASIQTKDAKPAFEQSRIKIEGDEIHLPSFGFGFFIL